MKTRQRNTVQCEIYTNPCKSWLKKTWFNLEQKAKPNFFLSWLWIGTWLDCFVDEFILVEAKENNQTVGLGIIVKANRKLFGISYKNKFYLHRTGIAEHDQIWIEYNDFLLSCENEDKIRAMMIETIYYNISKSHPIVIGASEDSKFHHVEHLGLKKRTLWKTQNFSLDLNSLRQNKQSLLEYLSRNSRYQILRSLRKFEQQYGEIKIEKASSIEEAKSMLMLAKPLHLARWNKDHDQSGFANNDFIKFHQQLIEKGIAKQHIEISHIKAGKQTLSIMYNFKYNNQIYFYLSAINYEHASSQLKPGLVSHYLLINKALDEQMALYDFMGGISRYKKSFSNIIGNLSVNLYEQPSLRVNLEHIYRNSKLKRREKHQRKIFKTQTL